MFDTNVCTILALGVGSNDHCQSGCNAPMLSANVGGQGYSVVNAGGGGGTPRTQPRPTTPTRHPTTRHPGKTACNGRNDTAPWRRRGLCSRTNLRAGQRRLQDVRILLRFEAHTQSRAEPRRPAHLQQTVRHVSRQPSVSRALQSKRRKSTTLRTALSQE